MDTRWQSWKPPWQPLLAPVAQVVDDQLIVSTGGQPALVPSLATYAIDMSELLLPGANDVGDQDDSTPADNTDSEPEPEPEPEAEVEVVPPETVVETSTVLAADAGLVSLEAEFYDELNPTDTHQWVSTTDTGASNNLAMTTTPDSNKLANGSAGSPSMAYFAYFDRPGTWHLAPGTCGFAVWVIPLTVREVAIRFMPG